MPWSVNVTCFEIQQGEFIQILHDGHGAIDEDSAQEIHVYDSMYAIDGMHAIVGMYTKKQIASIVIKMMNVQKQDRGYRCDCGLFAVAFATALANGIQ